MLVGECDFCTIHEAIMINHPSGFVSTALMPYKGLGGKRNGKIDGEENKEAILFRKNASGKKNQALGGAKAC